MSERESLRRLVRRMLGYNSLLYRAGSKMFDFFSVAGKEGMRTWFALQRISNSDSQATGPVAVTLSNLLHPVNLRPNSMDAKTVIDSIVREEYGQFRPDNEPVWMIDAGAYIGDTAAYFLSRFPKLQIVALEPNHPSYEMASINLRPYGDRVVVLRKGLAARDGMVPFGGESTAASIHGTGAEIECVSLPTLLKQYAMPRIDILKMDIEGAEEDIFLEHPESWLGYVDNLLMELHGPRAEKTVLSALERNGFTAAQYRSVWYCRKN